MIRLSLTTDSPLLQTVIDSYLKRTGKQIRPILSLLSAGVYGEVNDNVICAAASIEMLHNASLIHDDVLDESQKRRGMATINSVWDNQVAVLVGDYFVSRALNCAVATGDLRIIRAMAQLGTSLSRGEIDQIDHARKHDISEESYFSIIGQKTASLFSTCVEAGCYAAGVTDEQMQRQMENVNSARTMFLATIFNGTTDYVDSNTGMVKHDFHYELNQWETNQSYFRDFPETAWQVILFWWTGVMHTLAQRYRHVFKVQPVKSQKPTTPLEIYTATTATMQKYAGLTEDQVNNQSYSLVLEHLERLTVENEEMEKIRKK